MSNLINWIKSLFSMDEPSTTDSEFPQAPEDEPVREMPHQTTELRLQGLVPYEQFVSMLKSGIDELRKEAPEELSQIMDIYFEPNDNLDLTSHMHSIVEDLTEAVSNEDLAQIKKYTHQLQNCLANPGAVVMQPSNLRLKTVAIESPSPGDKNQASHVPLISLVKPSPPHFKEVTICTDLNLYLDKHGKLLVACANAHTPLQSGRFTPLGRSTHTIEFNADESDEAFMKKVQQFVQMASNRVSD